jgi:hypothetical protein
MKIIIDTREQTPWTFPDGIQTEPGTLATGDYSLKGLQELCTIERKSLSDLVGCMTGDNRERFKKELQRLKSYRCRAVIVEGSLHDIMIHRYLSRIEPEAVIGSMASWQTKYETPFVLAGDADGAARYCLATLRTFYKQCQEFAGVFAGIQTTPTGTARSRRPAKPLETRNEFQGINVEKLVRELDKSALISPFLNPLEWKGNEQSQPDQMTVITEEPATQELKPWERPLRVIQP